MLLNLDASVYELEAVQKAAYRFIDRLTVFIVRGGNDQLICTITLVPGVELSFENVLDDFKRELLDQQLRLTIKAETADMRNLILAYAFSRSGLQS